MPAATTTAARSFHSLHARLPDYSTLSARLHIELATGTEKSFSSRATLKILRDRALQISIQPLAGIEVMRIEVSPDSVKMLDRMNRRYMADSFANSGSDMPPALNFHNLQALFTNRIFLPDGTASPDSAFARFRTEPAQHGQGFIFHTQDAHGLHYRFTSSGDTLAVTEIADASHTLRLDYAAFSPVGEGLQPFPTEIRAVWRADRKTEVSLAIRYSHIDIDRPVDLRFDVPKNCRRVSLSQILKSTGQP
jgi:hypothetical protein